MRTEHHTTSGVAEVHVDNPGGDIAVRADGEGLTTVTLTPAEAGDQVAQDRIRRAEITSDGRRFAISLPPLLASTGSHSRTVVRNGSAVHVTQTITGSVVAGSSVVGIQISGDGNVYVGGSRGGNSGAVTATIHTPAGSSVTANSEGGRIRQTGTLARLHADTTGGHITIEHITGGADLATSGSYISIDSAEGSVHARTSGGNILARDLRQGGSLRTSGGSISAHLTGNHPLTARTTGGDLHLSTANGVDEHHVTARATGGIVRLNGATVSR